MGKIYLIKCYNNNELVYKIGFTRNNTTDRLKNIQVGNPNNLEIIKEFETKYNYRLEKYMHNYFKNKKVKSEWFKLNEFDVDNFTKICKKAEDNYDVLAENNHFFKKLLSRK